jgi:hypothetical protein
MGHGSQFTHSVVAQIGALGKERWLGKTEQGDEWSFCLMATRMVANRRDDEQETTPESQPGI